MGTPEPAVVALHHLIDAGHEIAAVYTQPDRPSGRGNKITSPPVKLYAVENDIEVRQPTRIRDEGEIEAFRELNAEVAVVVAYGKILPVEYLSAHRFGAINLHFSILPRYRGAAPVNWAIANGEKVTGVTTMRMDVGLDTGPILKQREIEIGDLNSIELMGRSAIVGAELLCETIDEIGSLVPTPQNDEEASYAPIMTRSDGLIDWSMNADQIVNRIRGFQPFPGCFTYLTKKKVNFWRARPTNGTIHSPNVGVIVSMDRERFSVSCGGSSAIDVLEFQVEGKGRMTAADGFNGRIFMLGDRFDGLPGQH